MSQVAELDGTELLRGVIVGVCCRVDGKDFVVAEGVDGVLGEESCVVHGPVVDYLDQGVVFVVDARVVNIDKPIRATREQDIGAAWVILELAASVHPASVPCSWRTGNTPRLCRRYDSRRIGDCAALVI